MEEEKKEQKGCADTIAKIGCGIFLIPILIYFVYFFISLINELFKAFF